MRFRLPPQFCAAGAFFIFKKAHTPAQVDIPPKIDIIEQNDTLFGPKEQNRCLCGQPQTMENALEIRRLPVASGAPPALCI